MKPWFLIFVAWPSLAFGQVVVGDAVPASDLVQARATLERATPKKLNLQVGEFEVLEPAASVTSPLLWLATNDAIVQRMEIAAQQPLALWMKRRGEAAARLHQFPAQPRAWLLVVGVAPGTATVHLIRNGAPSAAPVVVDTLAVSVGGPAPAPPTPPVEDDLTQALRAALTHDQQAGKADRPWLIALGKLYTAAARDSLDALKSPSDLDNYLIAARRAAGIPDPELMLPSLRQRLRQELLTQLNVTDQTASTPFTPESRRIATQTLRHIAQALEVLCR